MRRFLPLATLWVLAGGCEHTMSIAERAKAAQVVSGRMADWARVFSNRDLDSLAAFYHPGPALRVAWPDGRRTVGWREESAALRELLPSASFVSLSLRDVAVDVVGMDVALVSFGLLQDMVIGSRRSVCSGPGTAVWMLEGVQWKIRALQTACANPP